MNDMMQRCMDWMMSLGWIGILVGFALLTAVVVGAVMLLTRDWRRR